MAISRRNFLRMGGLTALGASMGIGMGTNVRWIGAKPSYAAEQNPLLHVLNRVTWGIRPQDVVKISEMGIENYIDWQLDYQNIADPAVDEFMGEEQWLNGSYEEIKALLERDYDVVTFGALWRRLYCAIYSERQLYEQMVEFWTDHFNVPMSDAVVEKILDDREVIRKHALGKFRDLLFASAQSPAMLYYLDNYSSTKEYPNENYARELMELHTLGVDGGYTEKDVKAVARALTGWQVGDDERFFFNANDHDDAEKTILGRQFPAGRGIEDGLQVFDLLATHPSTAHFVSFKLCRRFVSDQPAPSLVDSTTAVFIAADGDIKTVMRHILLSPEFQQAQWQKFRRPIDFVVAAIRAMGPGFSVKDGGAVLWSLEPMGQLPYFWLPPNGYPEPAGAWMNTNGLLARWNFGLVMPLASQGWIDGARFNMEKSIPLRDTVSEMVDSATALVIGANIEPADRQMLIDLVSKGQGDVPMTRELRNDMLPTLLGVLVASPYFQWK